MVILTVKIRFSGREASSLEALRFPSLAAPLVSTRDGIVNVRPEAETMEGGRAQGRLQMIVDRQHQKRFDLVQAEEFYNDRRP